MASMRRFAILTLAFVAIACAVTGYILEGVDPYTALISSIPFIDFSAPLVVESPLLEIARWSGLLFALGILIELVSATRTLLAKRRALAETLKQDGAVAIHGKSELAAQLASTMGRPHVVSDDPASFSAPTQVILFDDDAEALDFYHSHHDELDRAERVIINLSEYTLGPLNESNVHPLRLTDQCAQRYWTQHPAHPGEDIVIVGSDTFSEEILTWGLLANIVSPESRISYTLVGSHGAYRARHRYLDETAALTADVVRFVDGPWYERVDVIEAADRVVICGPADESVRCANDLALRGVRAALHIKSDDRRMPDLMGLTADAEGGFGERLVFGTLDELVSEDQVLDERGHRSAMLSHLYYSLNQGACRRCEKNPKHDPSSEIACLGCPIFKTEWRALSGFLRNSNYAVAAHDACKQRILLELGIDVSALDSDGIARAYDALAPEVRDRLQELEHIRWMRFHMLHNWTYAEKRDNAARRHDCLKPYRELSRENKDKDASAWRTIGFRRR